MTTTAIPVAHTTEDDHLDFPPGLPDYQERRLRELWVDIPVEYRQQLIDLSRQLPRTYDDLLETAHEARRQGQIVRNQGAIRLMQRWLDAEPDPPEEQAKALEALHAILGEDYPLYDEPLS